MSVSPSGNLSSFMDVGRTHVAASSTFQTLVGEPADPASAKAFVYAQVADSDYDVTKWCAVIEFAPGFEFEITARGSRNYFSAAGLFNIIFQAPITETTEIDAFYEFANALDGIIADMLAISGQALYWDIASFSLGEGPQRPDDDERKTIAQDYYQCICPIRVMGKAS